MADYDSSKKRGKGKKRIPSADVTETLDLTSGSFESSPPKRSRRAADLLDLKNVDTISLSEESNEGAGKVELNNNASEVTADPEQDSNVGVVTRKGRGRSKSNTPKAAKVKKLSLTTALKVTSAVIPQLPSFSPVPVPQPSTSRARPSNRVLYTRSNDVDLTGDFHMTDKHSSAPLFQKQAPQPKPSEPIEEDDDNDAFKVNVNTNGKIQRYSYRLNQKFVDLYKKISEQEAVPISSVFLYDGEKRIDIDDTPHSVGCKISTILTCRMMEMKGVAIKQKKKNQIELKIQSNKWKRPVVIKMSKLDNFKTAVEILCEQIEFKPEQISLRFDGDLIEMSETPIDLEFEGGEILDCLVKE